ncbi:MAG: carboxypeptidase M32 [Candidatus Bathyarchaeota archaeon]|nr:carboxypeptidase M32 [Candidatus Bathyarchaeota archaeon]
MPADLRLSYKKLLERNKELTVLGTPAAIVQWDMETMMPPKAVELRSEQLALLNQVHHKMSTAPAVGKLLDAILKHPQYENLSPVEKRNVHLTKKNYEEQTKLPAKLVKAMAKQQVLTVNTWKKAKAQKNYAMFKPELDKLLLLNKQAADILMRVKETKTPYDALIDIYEPKMTTQAINAVFGKLQAGLEGFLEKIQNAKPQPDACVFGKKVSVEKQRKIADALMQSLGYVIPPSPDAAGRLDETEHPFTTGYYDDVRITTHYHTDNFASAVFSVLHETGHALYEQGLPQDWKFQPVDSPCSMGFHESQSRLYENIVGRSREFWTAVLPKIKAVAAPSLSSLELDCFVRAVNAVKPSKIRIESDEVTYNLHIIIRFQIEMELFAGKVGVDELPAVWNEKYKQLLGVTVENDSEGVMQDTHWASGLYGYFPTYALGNLYSGQIASCIQKEKPQWRNEVAQGNLSSVRKWLSNNIYNRGNLYDPEELIKKATKTRLKVEPFLVYLQEKYSQLYGL